MIVHMILPRVSVVVLFYVVMNCTFRKISIFLCLLEVGIVYICSWYITSSLTLLPSNGRQQRMGHLYEIELSINYRIAVKGIVLLKR